MSAQATVNVVDDEEMSSQGNVNAPVAPPHSPTREQVTAQEPTEHVSVLPQWLPVETMQQSVAGTRRAPMATMPIESRAMVAAPTVVVDAPSCEGTKQAFAEVSSTLHSVSSQHDAMRAEMQALSCGME